MKQKIKHSQLFFYLVFIHQNTKETIKNSTILQCITLCHQSRVRKPHKEVLRGMTVGLATEL